MGANPLRRGNGGRVCGQHVKLNSTATRRANVSEKRYINSETMCGSLTYRRLYGSVVKRLRHRPFTPVTLGSTPARITTVISYQKA